jgi:hypothetical protein
VKRRVDASASARTVCPPDERRRASRDEYDVDDRRRRGGLQPIRLTRSADRMHVPGGASVEQQLTTCHPSHCGARRHDVACRAVGDAYERPARYLAASTRPPATGAAVERETPSAPRPRTTASAKPYASIGRVPCRGGAQDEVPQGSRTPTPQAGASTRPAGCAGHPTGPRPRATRVVTSGGAIARPARRRVLRSETGASARRELGGRVSPVPRRVRKT